VSRLFTELGRFRGSAPQSDDMTIVMVCPQIPR